MSMQVDEEWRPIPEHLTYEASSEGRIRHHGRVLQGHLNPRGYRDVMVENRRRQAHRLVAAAFFGPEPAGCEVRHLNDVKDDNRVVNLAYGTRSQNMRDRVANGHDRNANKTHCVRGHPFDVLNTRWKEHRGRWRRACRTCSNNSNREAMRRRRALEKEAKA